MSENSNTTISEPINGIVKWFNDAKGFGFIEHQKGDVFVHFSSIETAGFKTLKNGEEVLYCLEEGDKGLHAKNVQRIHVAASEAAAENNKSSSKPKSALNSAIEVIKVSAEDAANSVSAMAEADDATSTNTANAALASSENAKSAGSNKKA